MPPSTDRRLFVGRPLVMVTLAFVAGLSWEGTRLPLLPVGVVLVGAGVVLAASRRSLWALVLLPALFLLAGRSVGQERRAPFQDITMDGAPDGHSRVIEGIVRSSPERRPEADVYVLDVVATSSSTLSPLKRRTGRVRLSLTREEMGAAPCGEAGDRIRARARVRSPAESDFPGGTSAAAFLARRGIALVAAGVNRDCVRLDVGEIFGVRSSMERLRGRIRSVMYEALPAQSAALVLALATGERSGISSSVAANFAQAGLSHLLAVSGQHLVVVTGVLVLVLGSFLVRIQGVALGWGARRSAAALGIPFVVAYTLLVGASASAVRAALMMTAGLVSRVLARSTDAWSTLAFALLVMLAFDPPALEDVSLQLSFAAVVSLVRLYPALRRWSVPATARLGQFGKPIGKALDVFHASTAATLGTAPLMAFHFNQLSLVGLLANIPAVPLASILGVPMSLVGGMIGLVSPRVAFPFLWIAGRAGDALAWMAETAATAPFASVRIGTPSVTECVLFYAALLILSMDATARFRRKVGLFCLIAALAIWVGHDVVRRLSEEARVTFLPVGQGDASVLELPGGEVIVVDTGPVFNGSSDAAGRVLVPFLRHRRIGSVDLLVLTHPHADHVGGLTTLAREFRIEEVWWTGDRREAPPDVLETLAALRATIVAGRTAARECGEGCRLEVLGPLRPAREYEDANDNSIVLRLSLGARSILLTGDAEGLAEEELVQAFGRGLRADVLKAGHHGSRSSSTERFLQEVAPHHVVMSLASSNRFGFPHREVLERLEDFGERSGQNVRIWRTDQEGAVTVRSDGDDLFVEGYRPHSERARR